MTQLAGMEGLLIPLLAIAGGIVVALTTIIMHHYRKSQRDEMDTTLKLDMLERGMSAEEIERVLSAKSDSPVVRPSR
jgi:hypothetical protein